MPDGHMNSTGFRAFFGLTRSILGLLGMVVLVGLGEKMAERFLPLYLIALGGGPVIIGLLNGLDNLLSALYSYPGAYLADRFGAKRALTIFNLMAMSGFAIVVLIPTWQAVLIGAVLFLSWTAISLPATMSLVARVLPMNKRTMGVSMHSLVRRIPMGLAPVMGGVFIEVWGVRDGVRLSFAVALLIAGLALILQQRLIADDRRDLLSGKGAEKYPWRLWRHMSKPLRHLLVADILVRFCEQIPYPFAVIWCTRTISTPIKELEFSYLTAIEMTAAMLIYIPVAWLADRWRKKPLILITFGFFTLFPFVLWASDSFGLLAIAFVIRGLKEFGEPTRKALIMDLSPEDRKAGMFGLYYLIRDIIVSVAAFGGAFLWLISPATNFVTAGLFGLAGLLWFAWRGSDLGRAADVSPQQTQ